MSRALVGVLAACGGATAALVGLAHGMLSRLSPFARVPLPVWLPTGQRPI
jgi:hypothetical protein